MEGQNSLLPHILQSLSDKPELCDTYENLCDEIKYVFSSESLQNGEIEKNIGNALNVGQNLGILTLTSDIVRMPFNFAKGEQQPKKPAAKKIPTKAAQALKKVMDNAALSTESEQYLMTKSKGKHNAMPTIKGHGRRRRTSRRRRRTSRRRSHSRRRRRR